MRKGLKSGCLVIHLGGVYRDRIIDQVAAKQHGVFSRKQAMDAGLTSEAIDWRIRTGRWQRLAAGVYANRATKATWERQLQACLLAKDGSVVAGHSAAVLHHIDGFSPGRPTVMASPDVSPRISIGRLIRSSDFDLVDKVMVRGFPATSIAETLWTVAREQSKARMMDLVSQQVALGRTHADQLYDVLDRVEGSRQRGLPSFRAAVEAVEPGSHATAGNILEARLYALLSRPGVPPVSRQHPALIDRPSRVDAFIPSWSLVVEADGRTWHMRQEDFQKDRDRDNHLAARGLLVLRFTYRDLEKRFDTSLATLLRVGSHRSAMTVAQQRSLHVSGDF